MNNRALKLFCNTKLLSPKIFIGLLLFIYAAVGLSTEALPFYQSKLFIPFFSWFLFNKVPNMREIYEMRIIEFKGRALTPPLYFHEAQGIVRSPASPRARELIQRWGMNLKEQQSAESQKLRASFERAFLVPPVRYELLKVSYNPIQRWKDGNIQVQKLDEFQYNMSAQ